jgi:transcriptional regulator with XRE-family HTH domain
MGMDGHQLRVMRTQLGMNQEQLAAALGVTQNTISRWESGKVAIRHAQILALALRYLALEQSALREVGADE